MKKADKEKYLKGRNARLNEDQQNRKYERCGACGLRIKAKGMTETEKVDNHKSGFHCAQTTAKRGYHRR